MRSDWPIGANVHRARSRRPRRCDATTEPESHTLAYVRRIEDELLMFNGIVLRLEGREIGTAGLKSMLDRHERWLSDLGRRISELEGAPDK